ncbi:unnamed protein product, partial [Meganyctiphanes norvegica]
MSTATKEGPTVWVGTLVHSIDDEPMAILKDTAIGVVDRTILFIEPSKKLEELRSLHGFDDSQITYLTSSQFLMPGMVDTHIHAPQFPNNGIGLDLPLLEWLPTYTFPMEATFKDPQWARIAYTKVVDRLLMNGTTTASYYGSLHLEASKVLADVAHTAGQRALVGKVNMLENCPDYYKENSLEDSLSETEEFIQYVQSIQSDLVVPIVTPRFAPTCPDRQMEALGKLAAKYDCHIQSHLCETRDEIAWVKELFPWAKSYTDVYDRHMLLTNKTIMAHCIWMTDNELKLLKSRGVGVSHCPNSNMSLKSGLCDTRNLLDHGIKVGLGTDCSGGFSASIWNALRLAFHTSNTISIEKDNYNTITHKEAFRMATLGGAEVVAMEKNIGNFVVGKHFDALLVDVFAPGSPIDIFGQESMDDNIQKFLFTGDDRNILEVYVAGSLVDNKKCHS